MCKLHDECACANSRSTTAGPFELFAGGRVTSITERRSGMFQFACKQVERRTNSAGWLADGIDRPLRSRVGEEVTRVCACVCVYGNKRLSSRRNIKIQSQVKDYRFGLTTSSSSSLANRIVIAKSSRAKKTIAIFFATEHRSFSFLFLSCDTRARTRSKVGWLRRDETRRGERIAR